MLVLVRIPGVGTTQLGAQRWFQFAGFQFTPSEFAKLALILMLARCSPSSAAEPIASRVFRSHRAIVPMILVFIQPDIGTTIVLVAILVGILVVAGARARHLDAWRSRRSCSIARAFQIDVVKDYQVARLTGFLDPQNDAAASGYNRNQAEIAIGSGGLFGVRLPEGNADEPRLRARAAHRLHLHGGGGGVRVRRRGVRADAVRDPHLARDPHLLLIEGPVRDVRGRRRSPRCSRSRCS